MFKTDIEISGLRELDIVLNSLSDEIQTRILRTSFRKGAGLVKERAVQLAPSDNQPQKKGGKSLRASISIIKSTRDKWTVVLLRCKHKLAFIAEYGTLDRVQKTTGRKTGKMPAYAFMRRAVDSTGVAAVNAIAEDAAVRIEKAWARLVRQKGLNK